ncbi:MAG TPA: hypothetical protein VF834_05250 [Streptosporangiaceae bacterium]
MAGGVRMPRSRGGLSGLSLALLGTWGGVAPYIGPSFGYGFTPGKAWLETPGRLYLWAVPGAAVLLAGMIMMATRSRWLGGFCALVAALGGVVFVAGAEGIALLRTSIAGLSRISIGTPLGASAAKQAVEFLTFRTGVGALILFFAALALGRFSISAHKDHERAAELAAAGGLGPAGLGLAGLGLGGAGLGGAALTDPGPGGTGLDATDAYGSGAGLAATGYSPQASHYPPQYPSQYPPEDDPFPPEHYQADPYPAAQDPAPSSQDQFAAAPPAYPETQEFVRPEARPVSPTSDQ